MSEVDEQQELRKLLEAEVEKNRQLQIRFTQVIDLISRMRAQWIHSWAKEECMQLMREFRPGDHPEPPEKADYEEI